MDSISNITHQVLQSTLTEIKNADSSALLDPCVICLEEVSEKAQAIPCCHQNFDFLCLASWVEENPRCPLCKRLVEAIRYSQTSSTEFKTYIVAGNPELSDRGRQSRNIQLRGRLPRRPRPAPEPSLSPDAALQRRREVYRRSLFSCHVGSNRMSRFQDLTPTRFSGDELLVSRAKTFIRRELRVFDFLYSDSTPEIQPARKVNNAEFLLEYIVAILKTVDIKGSGGQAEDMLQEFLGRSNTILFLHELRSFLRSPYDCVGSWDRHVQYKEIGANNEVVDGSRLRDSSEMRSERAARSPGRKRRVPSIDYKPLPGELHRPNPLASSDRKRSKRR